jgi:hypothetical protein
MSVPQLVGCGPRAERSFAGAPGASGYRGSLVIWGSLREIELRARAVDGHDAILNLLHNLALLQRFHRRLVQVPHYGTDTDSPNPQGDTADPHCGDGSVSSAEAVLKGLLLEWANPQGMRDPKVFSREHLALEFRAQLRVHPALWDMRIHRGWVEGAYPSFCAAMRAQHPPTYVQFANALRNGVRETCTWYVVGRPGLTSFTLPPRGQSERD